MSPVKQMLRAEENVSQQGRVPAAVGTSRQLHVRTNYGAVSPNSESPAVI
jgi:hypothetical protein